MKSKFLYLTVITLLAVLAVTVLAPRKQTGETADLEPLFLTEVAEQINAVTRVEVFGPGNTAIATLVKSDLGWQLEQMGGYRADWSKLQVLLAGLAQAKVVEVKTDKPEYYALLGVEDISAEDATGILLVLSVGDEKTNILIGNPAQGRQGRYVRLRNSATSVLVDRALDVPTKLLDWADATIIDIGAAEVAEVEIIHPQGESVLITKISAGQTDFDLVGLPPDREIKSSWEVNSLGSVFSFLKMKTVQPENSVNWTDAVKMRLLMFSGVEIMADAIVDGEEYMLRLRASHPGGIVKEATNGDVSTSEVERKAALDVANMVRDINQRATGWAYGITKNKYDTLVKKPEELLKPVEST